jgi:cell division septum initiation protein DivIVA
MTEPDRIRREIEGTQQNLSTDVNALTEKVSPNRIVERRVDRVRTAVGGAKDRVMGSAADQASTAGDKLGSAADAVGDAPKSIRRSTQGNPLAAGLIVFGAGWLVSSLLPASKPERELAGHATDLAQEHLVPAAKHAAEQVKDDMSEPVQRAADSVRSDAADAASNVKDKARSATEDVAGRAQEAQRTLRS